MKLKGSSLIEVLVAMVIVSLLVVGFSSIAYSSITTRNKNEKSREVLQQTQSLMEDTLYRLGLGEVLPLETKQELKGYTYTVHVALDQDGAQTKSFKDTATGKVVGNLYKVIVIATKTGIEVLKLETRYYVMK